MPLRIARTVSALRWGGLGLILLGVLGCTAGRPLSSDDPRPLAAIPFDFVRNQILIEVMIHGHGPYTMILDSGVDPSAVDLTVAEELGLPVDRSQAGEASGAGNDRVLVYLAELTGLSIGGHLFETIQALAIDLQGFGERLGRPLHGILGYSFLNSRAVVIDYPAQQLHIYGEALPDRPIPDGISIPMTLLENQPLLAPVLVNGYPLSVTLDTGSSLGLAVFDHAARRIGLDTLRSDAEPGTILGAQGEASIMSATVDSVGIGPLFVYEPAIVFPEASRQDVDGNLGNGFLKHFVLTLDYVAKRVLLERKAKN